MMDDSTLADQLKALETSLKGNGPGMLRAIHGLPSGALEELEEALDRVRAASYRSRVSRILTHQPLPPRYEVMPPDWPIGC